jgi:hypothetical protein
MKDIEEGSLWARSGLLVDGFRLFGPLGPLPVSVG